jgi:hypothetical protein
LTRLFPFAVVLLEGAAGVVYLVSWLRYGDPRHGWFAMVWIFYACAAVGLAMADR